MKYWRISILDGTPVYVHADTVEAAIDKVRALGERGVILSINPQRDAY